MNKKLLCAFALVLCLALLCAGSLAEISVTKKNMTINRNLDKSVNNVVMIMQDGDWSDSIMIASINSKTGRSVMTCVDGNTPIELTNEKGEMETVALGSVYVRGDQKSRGLLVARELNELLGLNISTYVGLDIQQLPSLVEHVGKLNMWLNDEEAALLGTWAGDNSLSGEDVLKYVRIRLESDYAEKNRSYMVFMDLLKQGLRSSGAANLMSLGKELLSSMDTNLNALAAVTMLSSFQAGDDRRELYLYDTQTPQEMQAAFMKEVYE